jgi:hypothetical protein
MSELQCALCLALQVLERCVVPDQNLVEELQGDRQVQRLIRRSPNGSHATTTEEFLEPVSTVDVQPCLEFRARFGCLKS